MTSRKPYDDADMAAVCDNPEWTEDTAARAKSFDETFPEVARRLRGHQRSSTKRQATLRLDPRVIDHFKATSTGWQTRMNAASMKAAGLIDR